jgi:hypothetical protein
MKPNSGHIKAIWNFFGKTKKGQLRRDFLVAYNYHEQTFYNKLSRTKSSFFAPDEMAWIEKWALKNGLPEHQIKEEQNTTAA